ncbi:MAG: NADH-quinone oxidoreductase subunit N [Actinomycetota bacterium]|nr:NADH-quinone oxidoreductase subunit N [Actinomycetota bacterium]MDP8954337.1 NADH-quinone oxidoreductase subunit N [Actinomycetota bacterium]
MGGALFLLTAAALASGRPPRGFYALFTVITAVLAMVGSALAWGRVTDPARGAYSAIGDAIMVDGFSVFFGIVITVAIALAALLADDYLRREGLDGPELYVLMLLSGTGGLVMAMANDLIVVFLGLETLSIALYVMAGFQLRRLESQESAIKYFVLGSFSSAFLLYGIALVYGATGSTNFSRIADFLADNLLAANGLLLAGFALLLVGLGFKVAAVPFHVWTPDVYQGAPTPVTAFLASASKAAGFAALLRVFLSTFDLYRLDWRPIMWVLAVLTLVVGSFLAVVQTDVKRMLAYSSISHAGFVLVGAEAASDRGLAGALFYLLAYTFMVVGSFGVATLVGRRGDADHSLPAYRGLSQRRPLLALAFTVFLLAQAGVPLTSGFLAKFYVIGAAVEAESYALALIAMISAVVSAFVYLRITVAMYMTVEEGDDAAAALPFVRVPPAAALSLGIALVFTVVVGLVPSPVVDFARDALPVLVSAGP